MASRTYIPGLRYFSGVLCRYIQRHQEKLRDNMSEESYTLLTVLLDACIALSDSLGDAEVGS